MNEMFELDFDELEQMDSTEREYYEYTRMYGSPEEIEEAKRYFGYDY